MNRFRTLAALGALVALGACDKNAVQEIAGPESGARVKFYNFGVGAPQVNFYANNTKMTAISSTTGVESTTGVAYGALGSGGLYLSLTPGAYDLTGRISAAVDKDLIIATQNATLEDGKAYSFYMSGFYNTTTKSVEGFVVEDSYPAAIDWTAATVRFVNAISNSSPMVMVVKNSTTGAETAVGATVAYKAAGAFVALPPGSYDIFTRLGPTSANVITRTAVSFSAGRTYSISARGDMTVTSATATNRPFLDNTTNR